MMQEKWIDLHMHSTYSDGVHPPPKLVEIATRKKLSAIALADHDSLGGFAELSEVAASAGIEVISAVELSCENDGNDLHVLAYGVRTDDAPLLGMLEKFRKAREERGVSIVGKLAEQGINLDMDAILARTRGGALGRPHIAEALVEGGHVSGIPEAFERYIGEHCPAYVGKYYMSPREAVECIHGAGGLAFVAHPGHYSDDVGVFAELLSCGFDGIEVHHPHHNSSIIARLLEVAESRDLLVSGGSDFHGFRGRDNMGEPRVPYAILERIREQLA